MGTNSFQAVKQNAHLVPKSNKLGGLRVEDRMQITEVCYKEGRRNSIILEVEEVSIQRLILHTKS